MSEAKKQTPGNKVSSTSRAPTNVWVQRAFWSCVVGVVVSLSLSVWTTLSERQARKLALQKESISSLPQPGF